ncbi:MAG: LysR family transcriptional regulator [Variibacter sp.]|nr:LysR family transcriptional regulator [Variibacter sp.]
MNSRHLRYFVTLVRERHHGRAAAACHVTQPTLSEAIRQLEQDLGVPLIERKGQRFRGLTAEGERVLGWAQRILADEEALEQELAEMRTGLSGDLRFGVIPAAMPVSPLITSPFCHQHPAVTLRVLSHTSMEIQRGLDAGELDAGLTYLENEPLRHVRSHPLYRERYMLLTPTNELFDSVASMTWREAAKLPLCLLTRDMQNRRIINRLFEEGGAETPKVAVETNSVLALIAHVRAGGWSSVVPHTFLTLLGQQDAALSGLRAIPLVEPAASQVVGLVVGERDPLAPLARAFLKMARQMDIAGELEHRLPRSAR